MARNTHCISSAPRSLALTQLKAETGKKLGIQGKRRRAGWNTAYLENNHLNNLLHSALNVATSEAKLGKFMLVTSHQSALGWSHMGKWLEKWLPVNQFQVPHRAEL